MNYKPQIPPHAKKGLIVVDVQDGLQPADDLLLAIAKRVSEYDVIVMTQAMHRDLGALSLDVPRAIVLPRKTLGLGPEQIGILKALQCSTWNVCGLQTAGSVLAVAFSLWDAGIQPGVHLDLCRGPGHEAAARVIEQQFGSV